MQMPMYGSPMGYNQPYGGWQAPQQLYQPQTNSFMPKAQNAPDGLNQGYGSMPWIFVSSEEDARNRIVQPNQTAWFMDNNNPYFYVKSCDVSGAVTVSLYQDGQLVPGAVQSATAAAANDLMNFSITAPIRVYRGQLSSKLQIYVNSQQVNTMNVAVEVVKE